MAAKYNDIRLENDESCFNVAKQNLDELENALCETEGMRTFYDTLIKEEAKEIPAINQDVLDEEGKKNEPKVEEKKDDMLEVILGSIELNPKFQITSLDLVVYAYIKEMLVNTKDSEQAKYLKQKCPKLDHFVQILDLVFNDRIPVQLNQKDCSEQEIADYVQRVRNVRKLFFEHNRVRFVGTESKLLENYNQLLQTESKDLDIE